MTTFSAHRLHGLEPDNLLAFMALLGLLCVLEKAQPSWRPRVCWTLDDPPLRPKLMVMGGVDEDSIIHVAAERLNILAQCHNFDGLKDLALSPEDAAKRLLQATKISNKDRYAADLWAALVSDAATSRDGKKAEPTPLCLMFGQGHQHFLERLAKVLREKTPPERRKGKRKIITSETDCLREALFMPWERPDKTKSSFRWDPHEDVRYALRAHDPIAFKTKETTQHGANRLAAVGLSVLTVVPRFKRGSTTLDTLGGHRDVDNSFVFRWPIWSSPVSLASIRALLAHPGLEHPETLSTLGISEIRQSRKISVGRFSNFTRAETQLNLL